VVVVVKKKLSKHYYIMNFVAQVEDHLRDLGTEARKAHPSVKDASERAIIHLRSLQTQYVAAVRRAAAASNSSSNSSAATAANDYNDTGKSPSPASGSGGNSTAATTTMAAIHPTTSLFQSQDLLRPFLLAANHTDAPYDLLVVALESIQHLLQNDAVCSDDAVQISRILVIQSWGCAMTLGLVGNGDRDSSFTSSSSSGGRGGGMMGMAAGALGGIIGYGNHNNTHHYHGMGGSGIHQQSNNRTTKEDQSIALKILRTMTMLVDSRSMILTQDVLGACILVCLLLGAAGQSSSSHGENNGTGRASTNRDRSSAKDGNHSGPTGGIAAVGGDVKRAAIAAMNQLLSTLFDRANDAMISPSPKKSYILLLAEQTMTDLCFLVNKAPTTPWTQSQADLIGPFGIAAKDGLLPSPTTSIALVDMIMKQTCPDLFRLCFDYFGSSNHVAEQQWRTVEESIEFAAQIICQVFQLNQSLLGSQYCYFVSKLSFEPSLDEMAQQSSSPSVLVDFVLYYYTTSLAKTLMSHYLSSKTKLFYANFDTHLNAREHSGNGRKSVPFFSELALDMIRQLVQFCNEATEAFHKSDDFEDGFIFTQTERESFDFIKSSPSNNSRRSTTAQGGDMSVDQPPASMSNEKLWRAYSALEALNVVVSSHLEQLSWLDFGRETKDGSDYDNLTISLIAKAASDLATSSASNRERILYLLFAAHAEEDDSGNSNAAAAAAANMTTALIVDSIEIPLCDTGATSWLAFKCILSLVKSLKEMAILVEANVDAESRHHLSAILNGSFAPSVSTLQHFIRRMLGSPVIVTRTLSSYEELACASMLVDSQLTNVRRQAILTSLCKLCIPSWGKKRSSYQLKESNIDALWTLLWIIHSNFEKISHEWEIILSTLDQLGIIKIYSSNLDPTYIDKATTIAGCFGRLSSFTTCFSRDALLQFVTSLVKLSEAVSFDPLVEQSSDTVAEIIESDDSIEGRESSISGKVLSYVPFAGRVFGGGGTSQSSSSSSNSATRRAAASNLSKTYAEDLRETTCSQMAKMKLSSPHAIFRKIPLPLLLVAVISEANSYRLPVIEQTVAKHLCEIVARSLSTELQSFAMEVLTHFMPQSLSKQNVSTEYGLGPLMVPDKVRPLEIQPIVINDSSVNCNPGNVQCEPGDHQLLTILCQTIQRSAQVDTAENSLNALLVVLEGEGHNLSRDNLITVMDTLSILSGCEYEGSDQTIDRSTKQWSSVSSLAFQNLKLILDEFLEMSSSSMESPLKSTEERNAIIDCCVAFCRSRHDVNTSLTATGMLWNLADRDVSPGMLEVVLSKLSWLAMDDRPELRNCSVNTLFSCVVGLGEQFTDEQWENCLSNVIFGKIMSDIATAIDDSDSNKNPSANANGLTSGERYKVAVHHSRDSARKQWINTQTLVLRGLDRVLRLFYPHLLLILSGNLNDSWVPRIWKEILRVSFLSAISAGEGETLDMRLTGVELMTLCAQLTCKAGIVAAGSSARVTTNMEVVGGALRSVRSALEGKAIEIDKSSVIINSPEVESCRQELFDASFDKLNDFRVYLGQNEDVDAGPRMSVNSLTQTLTKLIGELAKLYECCKNNEMLSGKCELKLDISLEDNDSYEDRFLHLLLAITDNAGNDKNSRYLNQVQRGVMTLLQSMAFNSSLRAFKALTTISGDYLFVCPSSKSIGGHDDEIIEIEAAKIVADAFESDELSDEAKVVVMCSVLLQYLNAADRRTTSEARYDLLTCILDSGIEAAARIDSFTDEYDTLDYVWDRVIATISSLLQPPANNQNNNYATHSKSIVGIVAILLTHLPLRKMSMVEPVLEKGAVCAVDAAFSFSAMDQDDAPHLRASEGAIHVFLACFMGLTQTRPTCQAVTLLINKILGETIEIVGGSSSENNAGQQSRTRQSLAIAVCESLRTTTSQDLLVGAFPLLCRLTNVDNDGLRRAAGQILGQIDLSDAISRERQRAEETICRERQRAEQADARAREVEEENAAMLEEIEYLQSENEELQRQVSKLKCKALN